MPKEKDFYTYVNDICIISMQNTLYRGMKIIVSYSAMRELMKYGMDIEDVVEVLEKGQDAPRKRGRGKIEKWLSKTNFSNCCINALVSAVSVDIRCVYRRCCQLKE